MLPVAVFTEIKAVPMLISAGPEVWFKDAMDMADISKWAVEVFACRVENGYVRVMMVCSIQKLHQDG